MDKIYIMTESYTVIVTKEQGVLSGSFNYKLHESIKLTDTKISSDDLKKKFNFGEVPGDENSLFTSLSNLLKYNKDATTIRKEICDFHKNFKKIKFVFDYEIYKKSLEKTMIDTLKFSDEKGGVIHEDEMCNEKIFGNVLDVIAASLLYEININIYIKSDANYTLNETGSIDFKNVINLSLDKQHYVDLTEVTGTTGSVPASVAPGAEAVKPEGATGFETPAPSAPPAPSASAPPPVATGTETAVPPAPPPPPPLKKSQSSSEIKTEIKTEKPPLVRSKSLKGGTKKRTTKRLRPSLY